MAIAKLHVQQDISKILLQKPVINVNFNVLNAQESINVLLVSFLTS